VGNKSSRTRKHLTYYVTVGGIIAAINLAACAPVQNKITEIKAYHQLEQNREKLANGFFETVIEQSKQVLEQSETTPPADIALYTLGEVYAHHDYAGKNFVTAQHYFEKLNKNFPDSPLTSEARVYINLFETIAAKEQESLVLQQKVIDTEQLAAKSKEAAVIVPGKIVENRNFAEAVQKNLQLLDQAAMKKPADQALYNLGLLYAHDDNPEQDYRKSQLYLHLLTEQFPDSQFAEEAQVWLGLFKTIEKIQQIDVDIEQQKKQLTNE
jgi:outer membrane protein assembly factor BamD (BamD/ComL family)